jgi:CubicO group peptidase (beta-lactamase class C family)
MASSAVDQAIYCLDHYWVTFTSAKKSYGEAAMRISFACLMLIAIVAAPLHAQVKPPSGPEAATADRIIQHFMADKHVPGLVLAVIKHGELVVEKGYGIKTADDAHAPDSDTLFCIGSLSKAVTAVGVEVLVEQGKVKLDLPASHYIKDLPRTWQSIPLKLFMAHQSGIPDIASSKKPSFSEEVREFDQTPLAFKPGTKQVYNNFNFAVAGQVIESASGKPYLDFMKEDVFKPLGMTRSGYGQKDPNSSPGHFLRKTGKLDVVNDAVPKGGEYAIPSGFIQTSLGDLIRLYRGIMRHKLLPPARTLEMLTPVTHGMTGTPGWFARDVAGVTIVAKDGAASGYSSQFQFVTARGDAVIFIMNLQGQKLGTAALANTLLREVCGIPLPEAAAGGDE